MVGLGCCLLGGDVLAVGFLVCCSLVVVLGGVVGIIC